MLDLLLEARITTELEGADQMGLEVMRMAHALRQGGVGLQVPGQRPRDVSCGRRPPRGAPRLSPTRRCVAKHPRYGLLGRSPRFWRGTDSHSPGGNQDHLRLQS